MLYSLWDDLSPDLVTKFYRHLPDCPDLDSSTDSGCELCLSIPSDSF